MHQIPQCLKVVSTFRLVEPHRSNVGFLQMMSWCSQKNQIKKWHNQMWSRRRSKVQWVFAVGGPLCCILTLLSKSFSTVISTILHWRRECSVVVFKSDGSRILGAFACWCWWFVVWCRQWTNTVPLFHYIYSFIYSFIWIYVAFDNDVHTSNLFRTETWRSADLFTHTLLIVYLSRIDAHMLDTQL